MRYELIKLLSALLEEGYIISFRLKTAKENTVLHSAPNNWKTERGAYGWAEKHGYEVPKSAEKASKAKAKGKPAKKRK